MKPGDLVFLKTKELPAIQRQDLGFWIYVRPGGSDWHAPWIAFLFMVASIHVHRQI